MEAAKLERSESERAPELEAEVKATRERLDADSLNFFPIFTVGSPFVMHWQLFMTILLAFCAVFIPYDAGFVVPTSVLVLPLPNTSACGCHMDKSTCLSVVTPWTGWRTYVGWIKDGIHHVLTSCRCPRGAWGWQTCRLVSKPGRAIFFVNRALDLFFLLDMFITFNTVVAGAPRPSLARYSGPANLG
jgi:hypothetical protein